ncbi:MAG: nucleotidyltransferase family protein [Synechococcus sp.]
MLADDPTTKALVLFGSRARGEASPGSDLDLLLLCRGSHGPALSILNRCQFRVNGLQPRRTQTRSRACPHPWQQQPLSRLPGYPPQRRGRAA